ncbi:MAG: alpha/beta hydrolase [Chloroflexota bacterium]
MDNALQANSIATPIDIRNQKVNYVQKGEGAPILLIHGIAASLHDWDELLPALAANGFAGYALDLLGHGKSGKPPVRGYQMEWLFEHFAGWIDSLNLTQPAILCGHSLGGYLSLEYARRFPSQIRGLILSNPYYRLGQLSRLLRLSYHRPHLNGMIIERTPHWMFRMIIDATSLALGRTRGGVHHLSEKVRHQTTIDYKRTSPGAYNLPNTADDLSQYLPAINVPALVIWGDRDLTLSPTSFPDLVQAMPNAQAKVISGAGHVPHQSDPGEYNQIVLEFLAALSR